MSEGHKRYPSELAPKFVLRFPQGMREEIREIASNNHRSMTAEIIMRLEKTLLGDRILLDSSDSLPGTPSRSLPRAGHRGQALGVQEPTKTYINELDNHEQQLVAIFRQLPENKRRAIMALIS